MGDKQTEVRKRGTPQPERQVQNTAGGATPAEPADTPMLVDQADRWAKARTRTFFTLLMVSGFFVIVYLGHFAAIVLVVVLQGLVFKEILGLSLRKAKARDLPVISKFINWYYYAISNYFLIGRILFTRFRPLFMNDAGGFVHVLCHYHTFISFSLYTAGFVGFVLSLEKGRYKQQFIQLAWVHMSLFAIVLQSSAWISLIFEGLIWFFLPTSMIIINDVFAFVFGFFFGRTRLIELSPRKTWEGFLGAMFSTLIWALVVSQLLSGYTWMTCPKEDLLSLEVSCVPAAVFTDPTTPLPAYLVQFLSQFGISATHVALSPMQLHSVSMAMFSSLIAPYGGFFASGFKRAYGVKDFADVIPGHGGLTDRMDCQFMMGTFSYIYYTSFVKTYSTVLVLVRKIFSLTPAEQIEIYNQLRTHLLDRNLLH